MDDAQDAVDQAAGQAAGQAAALGGAPGLAMAAFSPAQMAQINMLFTQGLKATSASLQSNMTDQSNKMQQVFMTQIAQNRDSQKLWTSKPIGLAHAVLSIAASLPVGTSHLSPRVVLCMHAVAVCVAQRGGCACLTLDVCQATSVL
jgi:hypothetical protein